MIIERLSGARGHAATDWLDSRHTFSFGQYYDPAWMGFGPLRVINEDRVAGGAGFPPHRHANMEILSYVLRGGLAHRDSNGGGGVIRTGELQWMSAGHGVEHSEYNASDTEPVHFLQIWLQPDRVNAAPAYAQRAATPSDGTPSDGTPSDGTRRDGKPSDGTPSNIRGWTLLASPDGANGSIAIRQQARVLEAALASGQTADYTLDPTRLYWLHVAQGVIDVAGRSLSAGDALGFREEAGAIQLTGQGVCPADVLLFDLPA